MNQTVLATKTRDHVIDMERDHRRRAATVPTGMRFPIENLIANSGAQGSPFTFCRNDYNWCDDWCCSVGMKTCQQV